MRDCLIRINNDNTVEINSVNQYIGEHAATQLVIALNDELCAEDISYYTLSFNTGADSINPYFIKFSSDAITESSAYGHAKNSTIYFVLPKALTLFSTLRIQVEAHTSDEDNSIIRTIKSPVFEIEFNKSVNGEEAVIPEKSFEIIEEMRKALDSINAVSAEISQLREAVKAIDGGIAEIEALIDESGVLE